MDGDSVEGALEVYRRYRNIAETQLSLNAKIFGQRCMPQLNSD